MKQVLPILFAILFVAVDAMSAHANNCAQAASQLAARHGGQVLSVRSQSQGGATVCVIKLRVPGQDGKPPRVEEFRVRG
jgi:hypothetical protein